MLLNTFPFVVFFIFVFILYYWKFVKSHQWIVLLVASYYFFAVWKPAYLVLLVVTTLVNYLSARAMGARSTHKKLFFCLALLFNLGVLFIFKYFNFFAFSFEGFMTAVHWKISLPHTDLLLPLGISFYTFGSIAYLADVYGGKIKPEKHLGLFALFLSFFPQLSAGPIERADELLPQLKKQHTFYYGRVVSGLELFTYGLFKKMVIADNLAVIVDRVFNSLPTYKGLSLVIAVLFFSWQIYADFSGYTDMARGIARMLGIELERNFNLPYLATSLGDFWKRWHMSLSRWFRDYVYIPLGGSRKGLAKACVNVFIVFTLCGLWHGANWNFVIWGSIHGLVLGAERIGRKLVGDRIQLPVIMKMAYTYAVVSISWIFFRANTLGDAVYVFRNSVVGVKNFISPNYVYASISQLFITNQVEMAITFSLLCIVIAIEYVTRMRSPEQIVNKLHPVLRLTFFVFLVTAIVHLRNADIKQFIYVRF